MELLSPRLPLHIRTSTASCLVALLCLCFTSCVDPKPTSVSGYPDAPVGITEVIYVNPEASDPAPMGTIDRPYPTLTMALEASRASAVTAAIVIAAGVYEETGALVVDHPVYLVGGSLSPEGHPRVEITGEHPVLLRVAGMNGASSELPDVVIQGISFSGGSNAIAVVSGEEASARFEDCAFIGDDDWIQSTDDQKGPYGLVVKDGARVDVMRGEITGSWRPGLMIQGATVALNGTSVHDNDEGGVRVERASEPVAIHDAEIRDNRIFGIGIYSSDVYVGNSLIQDNDSTDSDGMVVHPLEGHEDHPTTIYAWRNTITNNGRFGLFITDSDAFVLKDNTIEGHSKGGIRLERRNTDQGTSFDQRLLQGNQISNNLGSGVSVLGSERVVMYCNQVLKTEKWDLGDGLDDEQGGYGDGISVTGNGKANVSIRHNQVQEWDRYAFFVTDAEGTCSLANSTDRPTECVGEEAQGDGEVDDSPDRAEPGSSSGAGEPPDVQDPQGALLVHWQGLESLSCDSDWSPPVSPSTPPESLFPGLWGDQESSDQEAVIPEPSPGALFCQEGEDCEPKNGEEACGEDCEPKNGEEECGENCGTDGGDPANPHPEPQKGPPEYETVSCDDGDEDCEHGEVHVDCDTSHETDDLDDL